MRASSPAAVRHKRSEIGPIPSDWSVAALGSYLREPIRNGFSPVCPDHFTGRWVLSLASIDDEGYKSEGAKPAPLGDNRVEKSLLKVGDLLVSRSNTPDRVGLAGIYDGSPSPCSYPDLLMRVRVREPLSPEILLAQLLSKRGRRFFSTNARGSSSSMVKIDRAILESFPVAIPDLPSEQKAITQALSDVDALIQSLERLLAKKRQIERGAMQELLTGKKRLPGFERVIGRKQSSAGVIPIDWKVSSVIEIVQLYIDYRGRTPRKLGLSWGGGTILALSANNVGMGQIDPEREANYGSDELYRKWMVQGECEAGDVLLTMEAPLGNVAQIPDNGKYILSQRVLLIRPSASLDRTFLAHYMRGSSFQGLLSASSTGSTAKGIQRAKLDQLPIAFPPDLEEQKAIASILQDIGTEITAIESKVAKARLIKQGMMQELLTGRVRLV